MASSVSNKKQWFDGKNRQVTLTRVGFRYKVEKPEANVKEFFNKLSDAEKFFDFQVANTNP